MTLIGPFPQHTDGRSGGPRVGESRGPARQALRHYQQAIQHAEAREDTYSAGRTRYNVALLFDADGRAGEALLYARAALSNFCPVGPGAADRVALAEQLVADLEGRGR